MAFYFEFPGKLPDFVFIKKCLDSYYYSLHIVTLKILWVLNEWVKPFSSPEALFQQWTKTVWVSKKFSANIASIIKSIFKSSYLKVFYKTLEISQNSQENPCPRVSFLIKLQVPSCNFIKKEALAQVYSWEFCEIFKNTFFHRAPLVAGSIFYNSLS